jgi:hypothetical protein
MLYPNPPDITLPAAAGSHATTHAPGGTDDIYTERGHRIPTLVEPFPGWACTGNAGITSGTMYLQSFIADTTPTLAHFLYENRGVAASGLTLGRMGLYTVDGSGNGTLVCRSASLGAAPTANAETSLAFDTATGLPASYTPIRGQLYAMAVLLVGTTPGNMPVGGQGMTTAIAGRGPGNFPLAAAAVSLSDLPTTFAKASLAQVAQWFYVAATV